MLRALLDRALGKARDARQLVVLQRQLRETGRLGDLVGASKPMQDVMRIVEMAAPSSASVLITGETGSGKEIVARTVHKLSPRAGGPFVAINCSAIPESLMESEIFGHERGAFTGAAERRIGCFELADGGTLLLDEIGEMPAPTQAKLLRVLEDRKVRRLGSKVETPVDVRVVAATNKDPEQAVTSAHLRQDLYFRLNVFHIHLPPLREHREDIPLLTEHILRDINVKHGKSVKGVGAEVMDIFMSHTWPGNIRELRNVLERSAIMCEKDLISRSCLPDEFGKSAAKSPSDLSALKFPNRHDGGRDGARIDSANALRDRKQQDARRGTAGNQSEDATQQTERVRRRAGRRGVNRDDAARASYQADPGHDRTGVSGGGRSVGGVRLAHHRPSNSRNQYPRQ